MRLKHCVYIFIFFLADFDLRTICSELSSIKTTKWFEVGIQLGIPRNKLLEFKEDRDPLSAVVDYYLKENVLDSTDTVSWQSIVNALESDYVGEPGLAEKIRKKYCPGEDTAKGQTSTAKSACDNAKAAPSENCQCSFAP